MDLFFIYSGKWKPFRLSFLVSIIFSILVFAGKTNTYSWDTYLITFLTIFIPLILILYLLTFLFIWVFPPQKGAEGIWQDWWKP
ncbi:MAG TPA: hypothetical protein PK639_02700 [Candidatus Woesebacteria bacterium]|nr:hypothetical protein [Candidatus Woesebacteria bacterium]